MSQQADRPLKMDYMVYVDNSNDRFSLPDMIEKDCEALDSMHSVSQNLVHCCTSVQTSCSANPQQVEVMVYQCVVNSRDVLTVVGVINKQCYK